MRNILKMPTYEELIEMPNGELMKCLASSLSQLNESAKEGKNTTEKVRIYGAYETERVKRLDVVSKKLKHYFD
jgi:hypothetical protein